MFDVGGDDKAYFGSESCDVVVVGVNKVIREVWCQFTISFFLHSLYIIIFFGFSSSFCVYFLTVFLLFFFFDENGYEEGNERVE